MVGRVITLQFRNVNAYSTIELTALLINNYFIISIFRIKNICFIVDSIHDTKIYHK